MRRWRRRRRPRRDDALARRSASLPLPACGERSPRIVRCAAGEGTSASPLAESPLTPTLSPQAGRGGSPRMRRGQCKDAGSCMTHPGEKFYPEGVHWDDPIARGTLPDLMSKAAADFGARTAIEFRDRPISYAELEDRGRGRGVGVPARGLRQEHLGRAVPRQFAGSSGEFLRRAEGRRARGASQPARWRDRAVAQAQR